MQLTSPCAMKELCKMPEPRAYNGVESFEDKILILGGQDDDDNVLDSALKFDPEKNQCHEIASLPHPLKGLATVRSKDQVIVFRGLGKDNEVHNDVFMYDCKTGKTTTLPSMLEKRFSAVQLLQAVKLSTWEVRLTLILMTISGEWNVLQLKILIGKSFQHE